MTDKETAQFGQLARTPLHHGLNHGDPAMFQVDEHIGELRNPVCAHDKVKPHGRLTLRTESFNHVGKELS